MQFAPKASKSKVKTAEKPLSAEAQEIWSAQRHHRGYGARPFHRHCAQHAQIPRLSLVGLALAGMGAGCDVSLFESDHLVPVSKLPVFLGFSCLCQASDPC